MGAVQTRANHWKTTALQRQNSGKIPPKCQLEDFPKLLADVETLSRRLERHDKLKEFNLDVKTFAIERVAVDEEGFRSI
jgi:hypothetical protein